MRVRLAPSPFLSSLLCLKLAKDSTRSATPLSITFFRKRSGSSHLLPKLRTGSVSASFVCTERNWSVTALQHVDKLCSYIQEAVGQLASAAEAADWQRQRRYGLHTQAC